MLGLHCSVWSSLIVVHKLSCPVACVVLVPQPGIEPTSLVSEGEFLTTGPPVKSLSSFFLTPSQTFLSLLSHLFENGTATESNWRYDISCMGRKTAIGQHQWGGPKRTGYSGLAQNPIWIFKAISHRRKQIVRMGLIFKFFKKLINQPINQLVNYFIYFGCVRSSCG